jgi:mono/diheme cytochrome c family protein
LRPPAALPVVLAALLAACGPRDRSAAALYRDYCARCHGADGRGDPRSLGLYPKLDLTTSPLVQHRARAAIYNRIAEGYGPMPGFAHRLEPAEITALVDYTLERFAPPSPPNPAKAGR